MNEFRLKKKGTWWDRFCCLHVIKVSFPSGQCKDAQTPYIHCKDEPTGFLIDCCFLSLQDYFTRIEPCIIPVRDLFPAFLTKIWGSFLAPERTKTLGVNWFSREDLMPMKSVKIPGQSFIVHLLWFRPFIVILPKLSLYQTQSKPLPTD